MNYIYLYICYLNAIFWFTLCLPGLLHEVKIKRCRVNRLNQKRKRVNHYIIDYILFTAVVYSGY